MVASTEMLMCMWLVPHPNNGGHFWLSDLCIITTVTARERSLSASRRKNTSKFTILIKIGMSKCDGFLSSNSFFYVFRIPFAAFLFTRSDTEEEDDCVCSYNYHPGEQLLQDTVEQNFSFL